MDSAEFSHLKKNESQGLAKISSIASRATIYNTYIYNNVYKHCFNRPDTTLSPPED